MISIIGGYFEKILFDANPRSPPFPFSFAQERPISTRLLCLLHFYPNDIYYKIVGDSSADLGRPYCVIHNELIRTDGRLWLAHRYYQALSSGIKRAGNPEKL
jgi:hypothetical protein